MGTLKVLLVPVEGEPHVVEVKAQDGDSHLSGLQHLVGGYIEGINGRTEHHAWEGFVNEEGRIRQMRTNGFASLLAIAIGWRGAPLVGPVVFTGPTDGNGNSTNVEDWLLAEAGVSHGVGQPG